MKIKVFYPAGILPLLYAHNGIPGTYLDTDFYPSPVVFRSEHSEVTSLSNNIFVIYHGPQTKANQTFVKICLDNVSCNECRFGCCLCLLERAQGRRLLWELLTVADRKPTKSGVHRPLQCPGPRYSHDICLLRIFCGHTGI